MLSNLQVSNKLQAQGHSDQSYLYNPGCKEECPENCLSSWKVWNGGISAKYSDYNLTLSAGNI